MDTKGRVILPESCSKWPSLRSVLYHVPLPWLTVPLNLITSVQKHNPRYRHYCDCSTPNEEKDSNEWHPEFPVQWNERSIIYTGLWYTKFLANSKHLPVSRNSQVHRQNLMELTQLGPSTARNASAENLTIQRSGDPRQKNTAPECISSVAFLDATICPTIPLLQGTRHCGTCIHPASYQPLHCLKPESLYCIQIHSVSDFLLV